MICDLLPEGWAEQARKSGAVQRLRGAGSPQDLLRTLLIHVGVGCSLKETSVRAKEAGLASMSSVSLHRRLKKCGGWFRWMAEKMWSEDNAPVPSAGRRLLAVDASMVKEPGKTGSLWRLHWAISLSDLQCTYFELTDVSGGEKWSRFPVEPGDILIGDRAYSASKGISDVVARGGDVIVRARVRGFPMSDEDGNDVDPLKLGRKTRRGEVKSVRADLHPQDGEPIEGRLVAIKLSREAARVARKKQKRAYSKKGMKVTPEIREGAGYIFVWTSLDDSTPPSQVMEFFRYRWQIELTFKRLKSILELGHLPKRDPDSSRAWLHGKLLVALLIEKMIREFDSFSPWGYRLGRKAEPLA